MALERAELRVRAEEQDAGAVDLLVRRVQSGLDGVGVGAVRRGGFAAQREQQVQAGDAGRGRAARNAAVDVGAVEPGGAEDLGDPGTGRRDDGRELRPRAAQ
ncbi:hypothetical protein [Streptomyces sp. NPDC096323]|uniref:hypothetical protein n=1 Tax=Streptomyces sp. NPDC096323 TaxID=3155822 RepID=UPI00332FA48B